MNAPVATPSSLAIIAGGGVFPDLLAVALASKGCRIFAVRLEGHAEDNVLQRLRPKASAIWS